MAALTPALVGLWLASIAPEASSGRPVAAPATVAHPPGVARWAAVIAEASRRFGVPPAWISAVMQAESGGATELNGHPITSPAGAMGLMQVMPQTWAALRQRYGFGHDPYDPHDNILAGAAYLRRLYERYGYPALFAAYNAGPGRVDQQLFAGKPLPRETRTYLESLGQPAFEPPRAPIVPTGAPLFFPLRGASSDLQTLPRPPQPDGPFAPLTPPSKPNP